MKIAIVHDYLNQFGGAERVVEVLHELYPHAPIYTSIYTPETMPSVFRNMDIRTSFLQKFPMLNKYFKYYLLFYPKAMESLKIEGYDVVLSSSSAFAKGVRLDKNILHICYCYTPTRFVWDYENYVKKEEFSKFISEALPLAIKKIKKWDLSTIPNVNHFIAISNNIREKIKRFYNRESVVIYPPVDVSMFHESSDISDYFLVVSRLNSYKNIDLVIEAFNHLELKLKIVGVGPFRKQLENMVKKDNIEFLGKVLDKELVELYSRCKALIFPGEEDFGITPLEAQASGRPVIAYAGGGALETIIEGETGLFFERNEPQSLIDAVNKFIKIEKNINSKKIIENAWKFNKEVFKKEIKAYIDEKYEQFSCHKN